MTIVHIDHALLWCAGINYAVLILWVVLFACAHDRLLRLSQMWFRLNVVKFDEIQYGAIAAYKLAIILFNIVPYIAIRLVT
jgi:hypothetical protein